MEMYRFLCLDCGLEKAFDSRRASLMLRHEQTGVRRYVCGLCAQATWRDFTKLEDTPVNEREMDWRNLEFRSLMARTIERRLNERPYSLSVRACDPVHTQRICKLVFE